MIDRVLTLLLLLGLLTCPVRCAIGAFELDQAASQAAPVVCSCCQDDSAGGDQQRSPENRQPIEKDCGCSDCLCDGAVSEVSGQRAWGDSLSDALIVCPVRPEATGGAILKNATARTWLGVAPASRLATGRQVRIAHQSFLI